MSKNPKHDENSYYQRVKSSYLLNDLRNFRKIVAYDKIKSHKKAGFLPLSRKCNFRKTTGGVKLTPNHFRVKL